MHLEQYAFLVMGHTISCRKDLVRESVHSCAGKSDKDMGHSVRACCCPLCLCLATASRTSMSPWSSCLLCGHLTWATLCSLARLQIGAL